MRIILLVVSTITLVSGCASNSGVMPIGKDTFMVSRQAASGFSGSGTLKAEAFKEANEYCVNMGKSVQVINTNEAQPPFVFGNFPKAEIQFRCLNSGDPELGRPTLRPVANVRIDGEIREKKDIPVKDVTEKSKDVYQELIKLDDLRKRKIISEAEFSAQKKKLLNGD